MSPSFFLARHSPIAALAERRDRCKAEPQGSAAVFNRRGSDVANGFAFRHRRCASTIHIVRPLESIAGIEPQLQPALVWQRNRVAEGSSPNDEWPAVTNLTPNQVFGIRRFKVISLCRG